MPIVGILAVCAAIYVWHSSENLARGGIFGLIAAIIAWVITTEIFIKVFLSGIVAVILGYVASIILQKAFPGIYIDELRPASLTLPIIGPVSAWAIMWSSALYLFIFWIPGYILLDKSSWIGTPCPHCAVRGKTDSEVAQKDYNGQKTEKSGDKYVTYNLYQVTDKNWCAACGENWFTTRTSQERA